MSHSYWQRGLAQEEIGQDLQAMLCGAIRAGLEVFLVEELERLVGADWYQPVDGQRDRRNGAYVRPSGLSRHEGVKNR